MVDASVITRIIIFSASNNKNILLFTLVNTGIKH